jgi:hypothetical protein
LKLRFSVRTYGISAKSLDLPRYFAERSLSSPGARLWPRFHRPRVRLPLRRHRHDRRLPLGELHNHEQGKVYDFTARAESVTETLILAPNGAPEWAYDREQLWNRAEEVEMHRKRERRIATEFEIGLPHELICRPARRGPSPQSHRRPPVLQLRWHRPI